MRYPNLRPFASIASVKGDTNCTIPRLTLAESTVALQYVVPTLSCTVYMTLDVVINMNYLPRDSNQVLVHWPKNNFSIWKFTAAKLLPAGFNTLLVAYTTTGSPQQGIN